MPPSDLDPEDLDLGDDHACRVQTLLVSVRDIASSLHRLSVQLEREIGPARHGMAQHRMTQHGMAQHGTTAHSAGDRDGPATELLRLRSEVTQLRGSLEARVVIEQAKGMLMAGRGCSDQEAFDLLVGMSQAEQRKVREIAAEIVAAAGRARSAAVKPTPGTARPQLRIDLDGAGSGIPVGRQPGRPG